MRKARNYLVGLMLMGGALSTSQPARADTTPAAPASSAESQSFLEKHAVATYALEMLGMRTEALSGNRDGTGTALTFNHYFTVGAKLGKGFTLKATQAFSQNIDEKPEEEVKQIQPIDLYLTLSKSKILSSERHAANLDGYIRVYLPTSRNTRDAINRGAVRDYSLGRMRVYLAPSKSFLDGKLTLNGTVFANFHFSNVSPEERVRRQLAHGTALAATSNYREDMYLVLDPSIVYSASSKLDIYLEWSTGYLRHTTNGKWSSVNHPTDGQFLSPGVYWNPTKKITLNPYLSYQLSAAPKDRGLTKMDIGVVAQYTFL